MFKFYRRHRTVKILFLTMLLTCLMLGQISPGWRGIAIGNAVSAQVTEANQRVQKGIERYQAGDFQGAIDLWNAALNEYKKTNNAANVALVSENLARAYQQLGASKQAISAFETAITYYQAAKNLQQVGRMQTELGQVYNSIGQPRKAIALVCGEVAEKEIASKNKPKPDCQKNPNTAFTLAQKHKDNKGTVAALGTLGEAYRLVGEYEIAIQYLQDAQKIPQPEYEVLVLNSLGNAYASNAARWKLFAESARQSGVPSDKFNQNSIRDYRLAYEHFQKSLERARANQDKPNQMRSLLNIIRLGYRTHELNIIPSTTTDKLISDAVKLLYELPDTSTKVYAAVDLAMLPQDPKVTSPLTVPAKPRLDDTEKLLNYAVTISTKNQDLRAASFAWGALGHLYEFRKDDAKALKYTQEAILAADQDIAAKDSSYLWEWQAGRILKEQNKESEAVNAYKRAFRMLEEIRKDILTSERNVQFDFRDVVQPLYRELAQSQLELESISLHETKQLPSEDKLKSAGETINALKLAELQNYFGNDCIVNALNARKEVDDKEFLRDDTAVFNSIILDKGTAILLTLPSGKRQFKWIKDNNKNISSAALRTTIGKFRQKLIDTFDPVYDTTDAATLYDWIIRPFEVELKAELKDAKAPTLVFVQDGFLRSIPMAALYDSKDKKYLIQKFAIATTPSLRLTPSKEIDLKDSRALIIGVSEEAKIGEQAFRKLEFVPKEIEKVKELFSNPTLLCNIEEAKDSSNNSLLCNKEFLPDTFQEVLKKAAYPIIHIATHAQFGTIPEDTFIVAGKNNKLTIAQLEETLRNIPKGSESIELLSLTACQTGLGDDRATLGLAGIALQVGVKSAVASLWSVGDESTSILVSEFYRNLRDTKMSKAKALQQAQIKLIEAANGETPGIRRKYAHPGHWSSFILIGNWL